MTGNLSSGENEDKDDVSKIDTRDIYFNDGSAFFFCMDVHVNAWKGLK